MTHKILETLINHTNFATEAERHELLAQLDEAHPDHEPEEGAQARTTWLPVDSAGKPIPPPPAAMTSDQAAKLIALMEAQQAPRPVAAADVPEGVS